MRARFTLGRLITLLFLVLLLPLPALAKTQTTATSSNQANGKDVEWPSYGNDLAGTHYQNLDQITPQNVSQLQPVWILHTGVGLNNASSFETQPIVADGTMYISSPHDHVLAVDPATGKIKWTYSPTDMPSLRDLAICCGQTNRGVAVGDGKVFVARLDAMLVALDATNGKEIWKVAVGDYHDKYTETMAPLFVDNMVIVGSSGGEFEARGFIAAYDAKSGKEIWRFYTAAGPGQIGHDSWAGDSWKNGGAPVWTTPTVDKDLGMLYISTGNAAPDANGSTRAGDDLFTSSILALDLKSGRYKWHFQEVHHDIWDYDGPEPTILFDVQKNGETIPAIGHANKDGYYFILDRRNGKPIYPVHEVPVPTEPSWQHPSSTQPVPTTQELIPHTINPKDVPKGMVAANMWDVPQERAMLFQPGYESGPEWPPAAYSPRTHYVYVPAGGYEPWLEQAFQNSENSLGSSGVQKGLGKEQYGLFDALDTTTGKIAWQYKTEYKTLGGAAVAGDLVFFGQSTGEFDAFDAKSGKLLWKFKSDEKNIGGADAPAVVYQANGREYVAIAFGGNFREWADTGSRTSKRGDAVIAFALPQGTSGSATASPSASTSGAQGNAGNPSVVMANLKDVPGTYPGKIVKGTLTAPADSHVYQIEVHDFTYYPDTITVSPGEKVAIFLKNTGIEQDGIALEAPAGDIALNGGVKPGESLYFVFTAPKQPGAYKLYSPVGNIEEFLGETGTLIVAAPGTPTTVSTPPSAAPRGNATPAATPAGYSK
jgi:alcohol dehydrogenase (cytochrome c)